MRRSSWKALQTSVSLLDNLESFLSTFQKDLAAVAGQISELQDRSKDIDSRLKSRKVCRLSNVFHYSFTMVSNIQRIERPLSSLLSDIMIPPSLATTLLDSNVGDPWLDAVADFEKRMTTAKSRLRVKAARDLGDVIEGLRIVVGNSFHTNYQLPHLTCQGGHKTSFILSSPVSTNPK